MNDLEVSLARQVLWDFSKGSAFPNTHHNDILHLILPALLLLMLEL
jgi:hypothetical protein